MAGVSQLVATFILNAIWQMAAITALAFLCTKLMHRAPSRFSHGVWIAALGACLLIPTATVVLQHREAPGVALEIAPTTQSDPATEPSVRAIPVSFHSLSRSVSFAPRILSALLWAYGMVLLFRVVRLAWFGYQTRRVCRFAYASLAACSGSDRRALSAGVLTPSCFRAVHCRTIGAGHIGVRAPPASAPRDILSRLLFRGRSLLGCIA